MKKKNSQNNQIQDENIEAENNTTAKTAETDKKSKKLKVSKQAAQATDAQTNEPLLQVKNLSVLIKDRFLVKNVSFTATEGECWVFVGEDKSGKTSLIKAICGSLPINPNQIYINGKDLYHNKRVLLDVRICLDPPMFFKYQSVYQNIKYLTSLFGNFSKKQIVEALEHFNLGHKIHSRVFFLSFSERKMMALALAFLTKPKILLLDEPLRSLDEQNMKLVTKAIKEINKQGTLILITTRALQNEVENLCDHVIFMQNREIVKRVEKEKIKELEDLPTLAYVKVKYPHYAGKIVMDNFQIKVKLLGPKVLFDGDEKLTAEIVRFLAKNKITIYGAGFTDKVVDKVFASLTPFYKEEEL